MVRESKSSTIRSGDMGKRVPQATTAKTAVNKAVKAARSTTRAVNNYLNAKPNSRTENVTYRRFNNAIKAEDKAVKRASVMGGKNAAATVYRKAAGIGAKMPKSKYNGD